MRDAVTVTDTQSGMVKEVKNLGWLLRHAAEVTDIHLTPVEGGGGLLRAYLPGKVYRCQFASYKVMRAWVARPSLKHATITTYA